MRFAPRSTCPIAVVSDTRATRRPMTRATRAPPPSWVSPRVSTCLKASDFPPGATVRIVSRRACASLSALIREARPTNAMSSGIRESTNWKARARVLVKPSPYRIRRKESVIRRPVPVWVMVVRASSADSSSWLKRLVSGTWVAVLMGLLRGVGRGAGRGVGSGSGRGRDRGVVLRVLAPDADDDRGGVDLGGEAGAVVDEVAVDLASLRTAGPDLDPPRAQQLEAVVGTVPPGQTPGDEDHPVLGGAGSHQRD